MRFGGGAGGGQKLGWVEPLCAVASFEHRRLEHVAPTGRSFAIDGIDQVEEGRDGNLLPSFGAVDSRKIATIDPASQRRVADAKQVGGETLRDRCAQFGLERGANRYDVS